MVVAAVQGTLVSSTGRPRSHMAPHPARGTQRWRYAPSRSSCLGFDACCTTLPLALSRSLTGSYIAVGSCPGISNPCTSRLGTKV